MQVLDRAGLRFRREPVRIKYTYQSRLRIYIPDLLVFDRWYRPQWIEEIKPSSLTDDPQNKAKWAAAKFYAERIGLKFRVVTETGIRRI